jgi:hypothetical protein
MEKSMNKQILHRIVMKLCCAVTLLLTLYACTDDFMDINTDKSSFMELSPKEYGELFANALQEGVAWQTTDDMSRMSSTLGLHNAGYTACMNSPYDQYQLSLGWENSGFADVYVGALPCLISMMDVAEQAGDIAVYNVALIWKVFQFQLITDIWGPAAYSQAGTGAESIPYDSQKDIYYLMFDDLARAVTALNKELQSNANLNVFGTNDRIYAGSVAKWARLANTLRLRMAVRISNVDPDKAKLEAEAAVAAGPFMETNDDDALYSVVGLTGNGNGMPRMESFYQDVMSTNMESVLKGYNDPRMEEFWAPVAEDATNGSYPDIYKSNIGGYHGFASGSEPAEYSYVRAFSKYGPRFKDGNQYVTPINVMNAAEAWFLKAEGAWRGWSMGGTAQSFYEKGIEISIKQWKGTSYSASAITNYINSTATPVAPGNYPYYDPPMTNIPVKFSSDRTTQYEQILTQKWIALFPVSFEAWAEFRRTRLPKLYPKKYSVNANINPSIGQILTRCPFVNNEYSANEAEVKKAVEMIGGKDLENIPLWWDVNPNRN